MKNLAYFEGKLQILKTELDHKIHAIDKDIKHEGMTADWKEQATERENDEVLESLGNASNVELSLVNSALKRIANDEYFECITCGETMDEARLEILPFSQHCIACAEKTEH